MLVNRIRVTLVKFVSQENQGTSLYLRRGKVLHSLSWILLLFLIQTGCIEEYDPEIEDYENILVFDGSIIKEDSIQTVAISTSTEIKYPEFNPVSNCYVSVRDTFNNEFVFEETQPGIYKAAIPEEYLDYNNKFRLYVKTSDNNEYLSDQESILKSSPIDSIYYDVEPYQSSSEEYNEGLQFYTDLKAPDEATKNYRWTLEETWEIHTYYDISGHWDTRDLGIPRFDPVSDSINICWSTRQLKEFYTASTENLVRNEKKKIPLSFVPSVSTKLDVKYSILVKQFSLSDEAYNYHSQNNYSSSGTEALYQKQPAQTRSNISNINDPDEFVLGYFWASSFTEKRLFFTGPLTTIHADCDYVVPCEPKIGQTLLQFFQGIGRNVFLVALEFSREKPDSVKLWGYPFNQECIDCTEGGGSLEKPIFWE